MIFRSLAAGMGLLAACDPGQPVSHVGPRPGPRPDEPSVARNAQWPELAPPIECEPAIAPIEPIDELSVPWLSAQPPWLRGLHQVAPISTERSITIGTYGDWFPEGMFVLAYEGDGSTAWELLLPAADEVIQPLVEPTASDSAWLVAREPQATTVWRLAADGSPLVGATVVADVATTLVLPAPADGLLLVGLAPDGMPAFAELSAAGAVLWQGPTDQAAFDHALANDGVVRRRDGTGALQWEHDPRPVPYAGFPLDVGATWARLVPSGDVVAFGSEVALGGDAARLFGLQPDGQPKWSLLRPYVSIDETRPLAGGRSLAIGRGSQCHYAGWFLVVDDAGASVLEGRTPSRVIGIDALGRVTTAIGFDETEIVLGLAAEVPA